MFLLRHTKTKSTLESSTWMMIIYLLNKAQWWCLQINCSKRDDDIINLLSNWLIVIWLQAMTARSKVLSVIREIVDQKRCSPAAAEGGTDILSILLQNVDDGHLTQSEVEDQLIESVFSFQQGPCLCPCRCPCLHPHPCPPHVISEYNCCNLVVAQNI